MPRFHFTTNQSTPIPEKAHYFKLTTFDGEGETVEAALASSQDSIPEGFKVVSYWEVEPGACSCEPEQDCGHCCDDNCRSYGCTCTADNCTGNH